jgi:hypothetical protein
MRIHNDEKKVVLFTGIHCELELRGLAVTGGVIADGPAVRRLS